MSSSRSAIESSANEGTIVVNKAACVQVFHQLREEQLQNRNTNKNEQDIHARIPVSEHTFIVLIRKPNIGRPY